MQLMTWTLSRFGSRFNLLMEPYRRRVMHSAVGRFLDQPMELMVGLVQPDGEERVMPFCSEGRLFYNCEQFERVNSVTYRGLCEKYRLRFEFNIHSVFYPQEEALCTIPAFYLEMRANPVDRIRWRQRFEKLPEKVRLFIRLRRPDTRITIHDEAGDAAHGHGGIELDYKATMRPKRDAEAMLSDEPAVNEGEDVWSVACRERIVSLNPGVEAHPAGDGLVIDLPVSEADSGIKWRLVWGAHVDEPILHLRSRDESTREARFKYTRRWADLDAVMKDAIANRDQRLIQSRHFEKLIDVAALTASQRHLICQSFQSFNSNTWWCGVGDQDEWFSVWEGSSFLHSVVDVEYNHALFYLTFWPRLLAMLLDQWAQGTRRHSESGGAVLAHDLGHGAAPAVHSVTHPMEVEENANFVIMLQAYTRWTGDLPVLESKRDLVQDLARYLAWTDQDQSGFPSTGLVNSLTEPSATVRYAPKQTYLAIKRAAALGAAADLLRILDLSGEAQPYDEMAEDAVRKIEKAAWLGDHFAVAADPAAPGLTSAQSNPLTTADKMPGWDAYSIHSINGLLLPIMVGRSLSFDPEHLRGDLISGTREAMSRYGCGHSSVEPENVWISQNLWRDCLGHYLGLNWPALLCGRYWDLQVMSNTHEQSFGYIDTYTCNALCFYPRGVSSMGYFLAQPRLTVDRLAPGGPEIRVNPDPSIPQRWPLFPLADWAIGRIPICVVDHKGNISIEAEIDPIKIGADEPSLKIG
ncbi:MAG: DUF4965 domain-containing protein [Phycisphaeraceae bacterium]|nr:DUF4965 domain-containing protein [Phycisphaeraceae bacterium]